MYGLLVTNQRSVTFKMGHTTTYKNIVRFIRTANKILRQFYESLSNQETPESKF